MQNYNNYQYQPYYPTQPNPYNAQPPQVPQIQHCCFMSVPNEDVVKTYPIAPGNCVTFKIEGQPIVMEKSMGLSQLGAPQIERYRLVRENGNETNEEPPICAETDGDGDSPVKELERKIEVLERSLGALERKVDSKLSRNPAPKKGLQN